MNGDFRLKIELFLSEPYHTSKAWGAFISTCALIGDNAVFLILILHLQMANTEYSSCCECPSCGEDYEAEDYIKSRTKHIDCEECAEKMPAMIIEYIEEIPEDMDIRYVESIHAYLDTRLLQAAGQGDIRNMEILLKSGVGINCVDPDRRRRPSNGYTPLICATVKNQIQAVQFLINWSTYVSQSEMSADFSKSNDRKLSDIASQPDDSNLSADSNQPEHKRSSVFIDHRCKQGRTALAYAARDSCMEIAQILLKSGADVESKDNSNCTPLILCFKREANTQMIKMLLDAGGDLRIADVDGPSALDMAILRSSATPEQLAFLYAAGSPIRSAEVKKNIKTEKYRDLIPQFYMEDQNPMLDLLSLCRKQIRTMLLSPTMGNKKYLNSTVVAQLPLPKLLQDIILFSVDIEGILES